MEESKHQGSTWKQKERIDRICAAVFNQNPGFKEYVDAQPPYTGVDLDDVINNLDITSEASVARTYFLFAISEAERPENKAAELVHLNPLIDFFEDAMLRPPVEAVAQMMAFRYGDNLESKVGPALTEKGNEDWGASIKRLRAFEARAREAKGIENEGKK